MKNKNNLLSVICLLALCILASCKKDELPSTEAKGRDLLYLSGEGKARVYRDRNFLSRKYYVNMSKSDDPVAGLTSLTKGASAYDHSGKMVNHFTLAMGTPGDKYDFPFRGKLSFEWASDHPNEIDTVVSDMLLIREDGTTYTYNRVNAFITKNFKISDDAILIEGEMEVESLDWTFPQSTAVFRSLKKRTYHILIDKKL
jgi:hypothetical protein